MTADSSKNNASNLDAFKWILASLFALTGIVGFYIFASYPLLYRVIGLLLGMITGAFFALSTTKGQELKMLMHNTRVEVRKMVWASRAETIQTTLVVFVVVLIMALFLWLLDRLLGYLVQLLLG